ncbi:unnamed protein product [Symbiodinium necroappetens]|uniref:Uncharacterized protein n=1 Tax=Symbiodinium necroappetens TaxID=1628268 RepID=A0A812VW37_9DINO|nr:unnamed protein product [Symbiodinium necroappetens]|eukprot:CAMPEP_0181442092 /NCGR_PEP_ID=MMETSP1110-20121109/23851_1 /TAXON_ID=174948 /ORGANISM="Symbiodinium sp., Strain CCMP421" /LENGTH=216 /DNA_ID=CAMNT_0023566009 /DNA_START=39 /DNA_END=689 /DNA_ORIENTATION=+
MPTRIGQPINLRLPFRLLLLLGLFIATAVLQAGFSIMHYKVFMQALDNPVFEQELKKWGQDKASVKSVLEARGKDFALLQRGGLAGIALALWALDGMVGLLLVPVWISLVAGVVGFSIVGNWKAAVLYVGVLLEKCDLAEYVKLELSETGQVLTKRVARLPANLPFEMKSADEPALQRLAAGVGACFLAWFLARTVRGYFKPAEEEEEPEEKSKSD